MASRVRIAAAACVIASGLFVGGAGATMAFADPEPGPGGEVGGTGTPGAPVPAGETQASGPSAERPADLGVAEPGVAEPGVSESGIAGLGPRPTSHVGNGRTGTESGAPAEPTGPSSTSKHRDPGSTSTPQTLSTVPGESLPGASAEAADPSGPTAVLPPTDTDTPVPTKTTDSTGATPPAKEGWHHGGKGGKDGEDEEHPGWGGHWWPPCPDPGQPPGLPPGGGGGGGGGGAMGAQPPNGRPEPPPAMQLPLPREVVSPTLPGVTLDPVIDAVTGLATAAAELPFTSVTLPVIVAPVGAGPGGGGGAGAGGPGAGIRPGSPSAPSASSGSGQNAPPQRPAREQAPAFNANLGTMPDSYRVGYGAYLRSAGVGQMMAVAVPGITGILVLTGAGGLLGYRQARAGHAVRANGTSRFIS